MSALMSNASDGALSDCACAAMNDVGEPCTGERHAGSIGGPLAERCDSSGDCWFRVGDRRATTTTSSGPESRTSTVEPVAHLTWSCSGGYPTALSVIRLTN